MAFKNCFSASTDEIWIGLNDRKSEGFLNGLIIPLSVSLAGNPGGLMCQLKEMIAFLSGER